jgi:hypothetical protein
MRPLACHPEPKHRHTDGSFDAHLVLKRETGSAAVREKRNRLRSSPAEPIHAVRQTSARKRRKARPQVKRARKWKFCSNQNAKPEMLPARESLTRRRLLASKTDGMLDLASTTGRFEMPEAENCRKLRRQS